MEAVKITLEDVFSFWRANEAWNPKWQQVAKEKGFDSWHAWRRKYIERLEEVTDAEWKLEAFDGSLDELTGWLGGPFTGWIKNIYGGQSSMAFSEIVKQPFIEGHEYIWGLVNHFPRHTILSVVEDAAGRVIVVEGMHRVCALTLLARTGKKHDGLILIARGKLKKDTELSFDVHP